jgi:formylglycine-generating enzyme required for sulfatase activity
MSNNWQGGFPNANSKADGFYSTAPVKSYAPNGFGLYDMSANVWEWCSDWESFFTEEPISDPVGPATGQYKQVRGGCFADNFERWFQVHTRHVMPPTYNSGTIGFRLVAQGT